MIDLNFFCFYVQVAKDLRPLLHEVKHPNVVPILGFAHAAVDDKQSYTVLFPFIGKKDVRRYVTEMKASKEKRLELVSDESASERKGASPLAAEKIKPSFGGEFQTRDVAKGLRHLHECHGIIHADLKSVRKNVPFFSPLAFAGANSLTGKPPYCRTT